MPEQDDHQLLAEFVRKDSESAFSELVRRYIALVYSTALRFSSNPHHAEEITQAVFIILARKAGTLSSRVVLSGWLYQAARLTAANFVKGEIRRARREQEVYMQSTLPHAEPTDWDQLAPLLDEAMGKLGETDRNALILRFFENRTSAQIGSALRMDEETARRRVNRALDKLRKIFSRHGVNSTTETIAGVISANSIQAVPATVAKSVTAAAVAKGTAVSTSTLTLVKGTLNIMTWTKLKFALGIASAIVLAGGVVTVALPQNGQPIVVNGAPIPQGTSILINSRFYNVPDRSLETLNIPWRTKSGVTMAVLSREQVNILRAGLTNIVGLIPLGTPRVIDTSGTVATLSVTKPVMVDGTNAQTGIILNVTPSVSGNLFDLKLAVEWSDLSAASQQLLSTRAETDTQLTKGQSIIIRQEIESDITQAGDAPPRSLVVLVTPSLPVTRLQKIGPGNGQQVIRTFQGSNNFIILQ